MPELHGSLECLNSHSDLVNTEEISRLSLSKRVGDGLIISDKKNPLAVAGKPTPDCPVRDLVSRASSLKAETTYYALTAAF
jgi:hypothetical protein